MNRHAWTGRAAGGTRILTLAPIARRTAISFRRPDRELQPGHASGSRQHHGLDQEQADQPAAAQLPGPAAPEPKGEGGDSPDPAHAYQVGTAVVGPRFFKTLGVGVIEGREFDDRDTMDRPRVAVVNETLARHFWPSGGAVGG